MVTVSVPINVTLVLWPRPVGAPMLFIEMHVHYQYGTIQRKRNPCRGYFETITTLLGLVHKFLRFLCFDEVCLFRGIGPKNVNAMQFNSIQFNSIQFKSMQFNSIQFNLLE